MAKERGDYVIGVDVLDHKHRYLNVMPPPMSCGDERLVQLAVDFDVDAIFHLAASASVTDSMSRPLLFYQNNVGETAAMLDNLVQAEWSGKFVFSSSCAVYGQPEKTIIEETDPLNPISAYGRSKKMCEEIFRDMYFTHRLPVTMFRYANVAGAYDDLGDHLDSHHVLQKICHSIVNESKFSVFGTNYPTRDGTCVRDYVHVKDICLAHFHAAEQLEPGFNTFNIGTENGTTVRQLVNKFEEVTGKKVNAVDSIERPGDPHTLVASPNRLVDTGFKFKHGNLEEIIDSAWKYFAKEVKYAI
jgi:UDP-glucose 4-epimerase